MNMIITRALPGADFLYLNSLPDSYNKNILWVSEKEESLREVASIASFFLYRPVFIFPIDPIKENIRAYTLAKILENQSPCAIIISQDSLNFLLPKKIHRSLSVKNITVDQLKSFLDTTGYTRVNTVREVGEYAIHGGLIDVYSPEELPIRLDFFGDQLETIHFFNPLSQKRLPTSIKDFSIYPVSIPSGQETSFSDYTKKFFIAGKMGLIFTSFDQVDGSNIPYKRHKFTIDNLSVCLQSGKKILFTLTHKRFLQILFNKLQRTFPEVRSVNNLPDISYALLNLEEGFEGEDIIVLSQKDLFGKITKSHRYSSNIKNNGLKKFLHESIALVEQDLVVHVDYGVGRYLGLVTVVIDSQKYDCFVILYANNEKLYLPATNSELISRFGSGDCPLDRLGGTGWSSRKKKVNSKIKEIADKIIQLAAFRATQKGELFYINDSYQSFVDRFPHIETDDQLQAIMDVIDDLTSGKVMDRLICGDVGFGKTEIALRASFLVASSGFQVIVIAPTTVLVHQHYKTFLERFNGFPFKISALSRYNTIQEAQLIKNELKQGKIHIIIGSHALLEKEICFQNPGLIILDEEQHFGVVQKEYLKSLKKGIHVLTLSATPIPRTLQLSLSGLRDLSIIATPPMERIPIATYVMPYTEDSIREPLMRELKRGGQSFLIVPHIRDIAYIENILKEKVPELRTTVAHGQLSSIQLDTRMTDFVRGEYDIMIATNIVESGLDIKRVNTIIIYRGEQFGLAQAYQLRGRVGRSNVQAYCYIFYNPKKELTKNAIKRLKVLQTLDHLGAGFAIANYDMDIRGIGNLLGKEQAGHVRDVGVELYQKMLQHALSNASSQDNLTEEHPKEWWSTKVSIQNTVLIPEKYMPDIQARVMFYKRLSESTSEEACHSIQNEMIDRFGALPIEVKRLFQIIQLKILCYASHIKQLDISDHGALILFQNNSFDAHEQLIELICKENWKMRPDQKLFIPFSGTDEVKNMQYMKTILYQLKNFLLS